MSKYTGKHIMLLRMQKGLSQAGVARILNMTQQNYSKIEKKIMVPQSLAIIIIAAMNASITELEAIRICFTPPR